MGAMEMYDYLSPATPDVAITLGAGAYEIRPQGVLIESGLFNQQVLLGDDGSEQVITQGVSAGPIYRVRLSWEAITEAEAGSIFDLYYDPAKAHGRARSFGWAHPTDGHVYVVRWDMDMERARKFHNVWGILDVTLRVLGYVAG